MLIICTVSWGVLIVNWLTVGSAKAEKNLTTLISQQTIVGSEQGPNAPNQTVSRSRGNSFNNGVTSPAVVLHDEGKLAGVDGAVSQVRRTAVEDS